MVTIQKKLHCFAKAHVSQSAITPVNTGKEHYNLQEICTVAVGRRWSRAVYLSMIRCRETCLRTEVNLIPLHLLSPLFLSFLRKLHFNSLFGDFKIPSSLNSRNHFWISDRTYFEVIKKLNENILINVTSYISLAYQLLK